MLDLIVFLVNPVNAYKKDILKEEVYKMKATGRMLILVSICFACLCAYVTVSFADIIYISDYADGAASFENTQAAYNDASSGDTIIFPKNGNGTWSSSLIIGKALIINGNGTTLTAGGTMSHGFFELSNFTSDDLVRITNFTFNLNNTQGGSAIYFFGLNLSKLRIDHNTFHHGGTVMEIRGCKGVIDHNYFYNGYRMILYSSGSRSLADASWESMEAGTGDALFVEDNHFIYDENYTGGQGNDNVLDTFNGGKLVFRYNTIDSTNIPPGFTSVCWTLQTHGSASGGSSIAYWQADSNARRGQSVVEIYENTMTGKNLGRLATFRGSANLVYNNTINSLNYSTYLYMYEEENYEPQWYPLRSNWPAEDQVHNTFIWGNIFNGVSQNESHIVSYNEEWIKKDRDYFLHRPATTGEGMTLGKEIFTGANGASSTYPTDGTTYPTKGTMQFIPDVENAYYGYTPYTYPHPLTYPATPVIFW